MTKGKNSGHDSLTQFLSHSPAGVGQFCGSFVTKQGHNSLPQQRPFLQPREFDLSSVLTFLSLHTIAALSKKSEQHSTAPAHTTCPSLPSSQGPLHPPGCADTSCSFSSPNKSPEKAHSHTCSKQILPASHPKPASPPAAEGVVLITSLPTTCSCSSTAPWDD